MQQRWQARDAVFLRQLFWPRPVHQPSSSNEGDGDYDPDQVLPCRRSRCAEQVSCRTSWRVEMNSGNGQWNQHIISLRDTYQTAFALRQPSQGGLPLSMTHLHLWRRHLEISKKKIPFSIHTLLFLRYSRRLTFGRRVQPLFYHA